MAFPVHSSTAVDDTGNIIPSAQIEVRRVSDNGLATLYTSGSGGALANPFNADAQGDFTFYLDPEAESTLDFQVTVGSGSSPGIYPVRMMPDVQADPVDTTEGALMQVGAFGLGGVAATVPNNDIDDIAAAGNYLIDADVIAGSPSIAEIPSLDPGSSLLNLQYTSTNSSQIMVTHPFGATFVRVQDGGTWKTWKKLIRNTEIVGVVDNANELSDAIMERGSNANGEYIRFVDGTQICWIEDFATLANSAAQWTFPAQFVGSSAKVPIPTQAPSGTRSNIWTSFLANDRAAFRSSDTSNDESVTPLVNAIAIGRWK